jgi:hypothetical protein
MLGVHRPLPARNSIMPRRTILQHTLVAALAASALASSAAVAMPSDRIDRYDTVPPAPKQDSRGERAKDPSLNAVPEFKPSQPTWPTHPAPAEPLTKSTTPAAATDRGGVDSIWLVLGVGFAASGIVAGSAAGVVRHHRVRARRVAA